MQDVVQHLKNLIDDSKFDESFDWLTTCFFQDLLIDHMSKLEKFQAIVAILLSVMSRSKKNENYEDMKDLSEVYQILYTKLHKTHKKRHRIELMITDQYYQQQLHKVLMKK